MFSEKVSRPCSTCGSCRVAHVDFKTLILLNKEVTKCRLGIVSITILYTFFASVVLNNVHFMFNEESAVPEHTGTAHGFLIISTFSGQFRLATLYDFCNERNR